MSLIVFVLQLLSWPVVIFVLLVLSVLAAAMLVQLALWVGGALDRFWSPVARGSLQRLTLPIATSLIFFAHALLLWYVREELDSPVVIISAVFAVTGVMMTITSWLTNLFAPPLSQAHFDLAMAEQTEVIKEGNAQVVAALSEMTQQMSELSGDIRAVLESRTGNEASAGHATDAQD